MGSEGIRSFRGYTIVDSTRMTEHDFVDFAEERLDTGLCQHHSINPLNHNDVIYCDFPFLHIGLHGDILRNQDVLTANEKSSLTKVFVE